MKLDAYEKSTRHEATVVSSTPITEEGADAEVREIMLEVGDDIELQPGQSIGVLVPGPHAHGHDVHFRLYSVADAAEKVSGEPSVITIAVRRVTYLDEYSGERYDGIASNYLCDRKTGDTITITGPYGFAFELPDDRETNLILIGTGTGIAPFRAFVKNLYETRPDWQGKVRLFFGAHTGLEHIYMNEQRDDFALYYDQETFEAFKAVSPRPNWSDPIAWDYCLEERSDEILAMLDDPKTHVYVAGLQSVRDELV